MALEDEADAGPDTISPRDFVDNNKVRFTLFLLLECFFPEVKHAGQQHGAGGCTERQHAVISCSPLAAAAICAGDRRARMGLLVPVVLCTLAWLCGLRCMGPTMQPLSCACR